MKQIFETNLQREKAKFIEESSIKLNKLKDFELKDIAIEWSYFSGKVEGNALTLIQTITLLKDNILKGRFDDGLMTKNMYNTLIREMDYTRRGNIEVIDKKLIFRVHKSLTKGLISDEDSGRIRKEPIKDITGTAYKPPKSFDDVYRKFSETLYNQKNYYGIEKAIYLHCNLARTQPFLDGNKRTSRMIESIVLMNNNLIPTLTIDDEGILDYREALLAYYQEKDYNQYTNFLLDRQINKIEQISFDTFDARKIKKNQKKQ